MKMYNAQSPFDQNSKRRAITLANKQRRQDRRDRQAEIKKVGVENFSIDDYHTGEYNKKGDSKEYGKVKRYSKKNLPPNLGSDASYGISGYVTNKKEYKKALKQK
jgi:hypothetical protein|tara:strand:+ start:82 stop:396 length:315 start_codon:yes stop_codon:yes gene_type:complete